MLQRIQDVLKQRAQTLRVLTTDQHGATATEYGILVAFLAMALVLGVTTFGQALNMHYQTLAAALSTALGIP